MKRRLIFGLVTVLLALNLAIGAKIYLTSAHAASKKIRRTRTLENFAEVLQKVRASYVDGTNLTYHSLVESALKGMVGSLDPHSEFMDVDDYQQLQDDTEGSSADSASSSVCGTASSPSSRRWTIRRDFARAFCPATASSRSKARAWKKLPLEGTS